MKLSTRLAVLSLAAVTLAASPASADEWVNTFAPYAWGPSFDGGVIIRGQSGEVDAGATSILDNVEFAALLRYEGHQEKWGIMFDGIYLGLGYGLENVAGKADFDMAMAELDGEYRFNDHVQVFAGIRGYSLSGEIELDAGPDFDQDETWADGLVGFRTVVPFAENWAWIFRGDLASGGSDLTWNAETFFSWTATDHFGLAAGWRIMGIDYEKGSGTDEVALDCTLSGPELGLVFRF